MNACLELPHLGIDQPGQETHGSPGQGALGVVYLPFCPPNLREKLQSLQDVGSKSHFHLVNI